MKYMKLIFVLLAASLVLASCKDNDDKTGSAEGVVQFGSVYMEAKENSGYVKIPLKVTGEDPYFPVKVTIEVKVTSAIGANGNELPLDSIMMITQTELIITDLNNTVVECRVFDNFYENEDRFVEFKIVAASNATVSTTDAICEMLIKDNDRNPYEKLQGTWKLNATTTANAAKTFTVNIFGGFTDKSEEANFEKKLIGFGWEGNQWFDSANPDSSEPAFEMIYDADAATLAIVAGKYIVKGVNFGLPGGNGDVKLAVNRGSGWDYNSRMMGTWSDDFNTITFEPANAAGFPVLGALIFYADGSSSGYAWSQLRNIKLNRVISGAPTLDFDSLDNSKKVAVPTLLAK